MRPKRIIVRKESGRMEFWLGKEFMGSVDEEPRMKWMVNYWLTSSIKPEKLKVWINVVRDRQRRE